MNSDDEILAAAREGFPKPGGFLFTGHAESLANLHVPLKTIAPAVYAHA